MEEQHFILFHDHTTGMELYRKLKETGIRTTIAPTPRSISKCCGISLLIKKEDLAEIRRLIEEHKIEILDIVTKENGFDIHRDKFC
jgi:hypothetical protein